MAKKISVKKYAGVYYVESTVHKWRERPDRCYWVAFKDAGKLIWERCGWASEGWTPEAAQRRRHELLEQDRAGEYKPKKERKANQLTLGELMEKHYLPWAKETKKTWDDDFLNYRKHLEPRFGKKRLDEISPIDVERMKLEMKKEFSKQGKPFSPATIKHQVVLLNRIYNLARRWGIYNGDNPIDRVEKPRLDNLRTEFLSDEEADRLLKTLAAWHCRESAAFVKFTLYTGLRRSELFKLTWDEVDFDRSMITLREPKGGKTQTIPISAQALEVLKGLEVTSSYVFPGREGQQRTDFKGPWLRIRKAAGLPDNFRFHGLRHHFASTLVSNGVDLCVVQALLTHKDARTTARYAHLQPGAMRDAALKSGDLLTPPKVRNNSNSLQVVNLKEDK